MILGIKNPLAARRKVLVVDDYPPGISVVTMYLEELGYDFDTASSGGEALDKYAAARFDAVLMDVQMPVMDGFETTKRIRKLEKEEGRVSIPIIAMTGRATSDDDFFAKRAGMNFCLSKPFTMEDLDKKLKESMKDRPRTDVSRETSD